MKYKISKTKLGGSDPLAMYCEISDEEGFVVALTFGKTPEMCKSRAEDFTRSARIIENYQRSNQMLLDTTDGITKQLQIAGETIDRYAKELARENEKILILEGTIEGMQDKINELEERKERIEYPAGKQHEGWQS